MSNNKKGFLSPGLERLLEIIRDTFVKKSETEQVSEIGIDVTPTANSHNLVESGGVKSAIDSKSTVAVAATGTATDEVQYIIVDGVEKKLAGGGTAEVAWGDITGTLADQTDLKTALDSKSEVHVAATGSATDEVQYIVVDGIEYKLAGGSQNGVLVVTSTLNSNAWIRVGGVGQQTLLLMSSGIKSGKTVLVSPVTGGSKDVFEAWSLIGDATEGESSITFRCYVDIPEVNIPITISVLDVPTVPEWDGKLSITDFCPGVILFNPDNISDEVDIELLTDMLVNVSDEVSPITLMKDDITDSVGVDLE